jgi:hypothetical protein
MKLKHNKKRNTAFLFETLIREMTRAAIRKDAKALASCKAILKEYFSAGTALHEELQLYRSLYETYGLSKSSAEKLLAEVRESYSKLINEKSAVMFTEQSAVIKKINKDVSKDVFSNFVPQYKNIATIYQIFNGDLAPAKRVLLEELVCGSLSRSASMGSEKPLVVDNLVMKNFVKKFNERYDNSLQKEQRTLLSKYVLSFSDNGLAFKAYLNEEIDRLRTIVSGGLQKEEISQDAEMANKTKQVLSVLDGFATEKIDNTLLEKVLKIQALAQEIEA